MENSSSVVEKLCSVDHVGDVRDVELVELPEGGEHVEGLLRVGRDLTVEDLNGLVGLAQVDLAVVAQVTVIVQSGDAVPVVGDYGFVDRQSKTNKLKLHICSE